MDKKSPELKLLLVDDSEDDRLLFMAAFRKSGLAGKIVEKENGDEAIEFLDQLRKHAGAEWPTVTFLDLKMPGRNGFDVLQWIQEQPEFKTLKIVVLSGSQEHSDMQRACELGAADYVVKPIASEKLRETLLPKSGKSG